MLTSSVIRARSEAAKSRILLLILLLVVVVVIGAEAPKAAKRHGEGVRSAQGW